MKFIILLINVIAVLSFQQTYSQQWSYQTGGYGPELEESRIQKLPNGKLIASSTTRLGFSSDTSISWQYAKVDDKELGTFSQSSFISLSEGFSGATKSWLDQDNYILRGARVVHTLDGGNSWSTLDAEGLDGIEGISYLHFFSKDTGIVVGYDETYLYQFFKTVDGGLHWSKKYESSEVQEVVEGQFFGKLGYLTGGRFILKTTDAGETWNTLAVPVYTDSVSIFQNIFKLGFSSSSEGWVAGWYGALYKTNDGGLSWDTVHSGYVENYVISGLHLVDYDHAYISDNSGNVRYTADGGTTWQDRIPTDGAERFVMGMKFEEDGLTGYISDNTTGLLTFTNDGGQTWYSRSTALLFTNELQDITFSYEHKGWAVGSEGLLIRTTNGGKTWQNVGNPSTYTLKSISTQDEHHIWAVGEIGTMIKTTDGETWEEVPLAPELKIYDGNKNDIFFLKDTNKGWAVGEFNSIIHFNGTSWVKQTGPGGFRIYESVFFLNENLGWIVGSEGSIIKTTNGGQSWVDLNAGILRDLNDVFFVNEQIGWAVGDNDYILKTTNGGTTWHQQNLPHAFVGNMEAVYFSSPHRGWIVGSDELRGAIYGTNDGGHTWKRETPLFGSYFTGLHFNDANTGWVVNKGGQVFHYSDNVNTANDHTVPPVSLDFTPKADTLYNFDTKKYALRDSSKLAGKFLGKNNAGNEEYAEKYYFNGDAFVAGVVVYHSGKYAHGDHIAEYNVFNVDAKGYPDSKLGRKDVYFKDLNLTKSAEKIFFNEPVAVKDSFFVSFNLTDYSHGGFEGDTIGILHTSNNTRPVTDIDTRNVVRVHNHSDRAWNATVHNQITRGYRGYFAIFPILYFDPSLVTSTEETKYIKNQHVTVFAPYPNPAQEMVSFDYELSKASEVEITLLTMEGTIIQKEKKGMHSGKNTHQMNVAALNNGTYLVLLKSDHSMIASKVVVAK